MRENIRFDARHVWVFRNHVVDRGRTSGRPDYLDMVFLIGNLFRNGGRAPAAMQVVRSRSDRSPLHWFLT